MQSEKIENRFITMELFPVYRTEMIAIQTSVFDDVTDMVFCVRMINIDHVKARPEDGIVRLP